MTKPASEEAIRKAKAMFGPKDEHQAPGEKAGGNSDSARLDVARYLDYYGIRHKVKANGKGVIYALEQCLFDPNHGPHEASIIQAADGKLYYQCFHDSCKDRRWTEARQIISGEASLRDFTTGGRTTAGDRKSNPGEGVPTLQEPAAGTFNLTDLGNAQRLHNLHGNDIRYCYPSKSWFVWDGYRWAGDDSGEIERRCQNTVKSIYKEAARAENPDLAAALGKHAAKSENSFRLQAMAMAARPMVPVRPNDFDRNPVLLNVRNGTLNLETGELLPHAREQLISKLAPVDYDPAAACPLWLEFLDRIMDSRPNLLQFIQTAVGYSLTGLTSEQCFFFLYGGGENGKSTFVDVILGLFGDYAQKTSFDTFLNRRNDSGANNEIARLKSCRLVSASEPNAGRSLNEGLVKDITGGESIMARFLYAEYFEFKPEFALWLSANHRPRIKGTDHAMWRRVRLIPFDVQIPESERIKDFSKEIIRELSGVLNWALAGAQRWFEKGLITCPEVQAATQEYRAESDLIGQFIEECCTIDPRESVGTTELRKAYTKWCEENDETPLSTNAFAENLRGRGCTPANSHGKRSWKGIGQKGLFS